MNRIKRRQNHDIDAKPPENQWDFMWRAFKLFMMIMTLTLIWGMVTEKFSAFDKLCNFVIFIFSIFSRSTHPTI